jgi:DNA-binding transcriptional ArsR family regulator
MTRPARTAATDGVEPVEPVGPVFAALSDATRRDLVRRLSDSGPQSATDLAAVLPISRQAVRKHLLALQAAGLAVAERHGREQRYRLTPQPLATAAEWVAEVGARWDDRLARLQRRLAEERSGLER